MSVDDFANEIAPRAKVDDFAPSRYQQAVFDDTERGDGHVVVRARAGSGKTTTILRALSRVPARHQGDVVLLAFNSDIAKELKAQAVGADVMTLHSYGFRAVIRAWGRKPEVDQYKVQGLARELVGGSRESGEWRTALKQAVSMAKHTLAVDAHRVDSMLDARNIDVPPLGGDPDAERATFIGQVMEILAMCREESATIDFDDQCWLPVVNDYRTRPFGRVFVDELQDLNAVQLRLALGASKRGGRIVGVGDDRQAIYAFRGADAGAMPRTIRELDARVLPLSVCYRCASSIVDEARLLVPDIEAAPGARVGEVRTESIEKMRREAAPGDFIISRVNAPLMRLCLEFLRDGRRAVMRGRDVGASLAGFVRRARAEGSFAIGDFVDHVERWREHEVARLTAKERDTTEANDKADCLLAIAEGAAHIDEVERRVANLFTDDNDETRIVLTSAHRAKGKERERAWILRDTFRPQNGGQEANLLYVAQTRAKGSLFYVQGMP